MRSEVGNVKAVDLDGGTGKYGGQSDAEVFYNLSCSTAHIDDVEG